jgi:hypothetical protein
MQKHRLIGIHVPWKPSDQKHRDTVQENWLLKGYSQWDPSDRESEIITLKHQLPQDYFPWDPGGQELCVRNFKANFSNRLDDGAHVI